MRFPFTKPASVASITSGLTKMAAQLDAHAASQQNAADAARARADHHDREAAAAKRVHERISGLVA